MRLEQASKNGIRRHVDECRTCLNARLGGSLWPGAHLAPIGDFTLNRQVDHQMLRGHPVGGASVHRENSATANRPVLLAKPSARRLSDHSVSAAKPPTIDYSSPKLVIAIHQTC